MENEQISNLNSYLSNIEQEAKNLQSKYTNKDQFEPEDIERLLNILDKIDERISNLSINDDEDINNENK
jgi:hypothetical protein